MKLLRKIWPFKRKDKSKDEESLWGKAMVQFRKNRIAVWSLRIVKVLIIIAIFADFLANDKPIVCQYNGTVYFPVIKSYAVDLGMSTWPEELQRVKWSDMEYDWVIRTPIPYTATDIDKVNYGFKSPSDDPLPKHLQGLSADSLAALYPYPKKIPGKRQTLKSGYWRHWLGTDSSGRDVAAGLIHGTRISLSVGLISMGIAGLIGLILGALAGYLGDDRLQVSRGRLLMNGVFFYFALFYSFGARGYVIADAYQESILSFLWEFLLTLLIFTSIMYAVNWVAAKLKKYPWMAKKVAIPMDILIMRLIEIMLSIPTLFLIIAMIAAFQTQSIFLIMVIIGLTTWTGIARLIRGELLKVRRLEYIEAAQALGFSEMRIVLRHAIPNALSPVLIALAFGVASAILTEAFLSFLGMLPDDLVTWGSMLNSSRESTTGEAWWLAVFPGIAIFITVTIMNLIGEGLTDALDPRLRK